MSLANGQAMKEESVNKQMNNETNKQTHYTY